MGKMNDVLGAHNNKIGQAFLCVKLLKLLLLKAKLLYIWNVYCNFATVFKGLLRNKCKSHCTIII